MKKREGSGGYVWIGRRLTRWILSLTLAAFILAFMLIIFISYRQQSRHEVTLQLEQMERTASQLFMLQNTVEHIADLLVWDGSMQNRMPEKTDTVGMQLYKKRELHNSLAGYAHLSDQIEEIMLYIAETDESPAQTYTSREIRGDFVPEKEDWFMSFLSEEKASGYTAVHSSAPQQNGYTTDVVSYVMGYYGRGYTGSLKGYLTINIEENAIRDISEIRSDLIEGYWLLDGENRPLAESMPVDFPTEDAITGNTEGIWRDRTGDIYLVTSDMSGGWHLISRVSRLRLLHQCLRGILPAAVILPVVVLVLLLILHRLIRRVVEPIEKLTAAASEVGAGNLRKSVDIRTGDEVEILADAFNEMVVDIRHLMKELVEHEKKIQKMNTENLLLQINPHFIYNTMNTIVYMARMGGNPEIADFTNSFISLLQHTLKVRSSMLNVLSDELEAVRSYLHLQEYRYGEKFTYEIDCPARLLGCEVPAMILQPVVENAVFHGIAPKPGEGKLQIEIYEKEAELFLCVRDDGVGMAPETLSELMDPGYVQKGGVHKIGLGNVRERIREIYGEPYDLKIGSIPDEGTTVTIQIPLRFAPENSQEENDHGSAENLQDK